MGERGYNTQNDWSDHYSHVLYFCIQEDIVRIMQCTNHILEVNDGYFQWYSENIYKCIHRWLFGIWVNDDCLRKLTMVLVWCEEIKLRKISFYSAWGHCFGSSSFKIRDRSRQDEGGGSWETSTSHLYEWCSYISRTCMFLYVFY